MHEMQFLSPFNPIQDGLSRGCSRMGRGGGVQKGPFPKIWHSYTKMLELGTVITYLKRIQKIYKSSKQLSLYQEIQI